MLIKSLARVSWIREEQKNKTTTKNSDWMKPESQEGKCWRSVSEVFAKENVTSLLSDVNIIAAISNALNTRVENVTR